MDARYSIEVVRGKYPFTVLDRFLITAYTQEIKPGMIELMKPKLTFTQSEIQDGDIICFQVDISEKEWVHTAIVNVPYSPTYDDRIHDVESQGLYSNPSVFYDFLQNRVMIVFKPKFEEADHENPEFSLTLSKKQNYDAVKLIIDRLYASSLTHAYSRCPRKSENG